MGVRESLMFASTKVVEKKKKIIIKVKNFIGTPANLNGNLVVLIVLVTAR